MAFNILEYVTFSYNAEIERKEIKEDVRKKLANSEIIHPMYIRVLQKLFEDMLLS